MKKTTTMMIALAAGLIGASPTFAVTLTFDELPDFEFVDGFYAGGPSFPAGLTGPDYGATFGGADGSSALVEANGAFTYYTGGPSPTAVLAPQVVPGLSSVLNVAGGFIGTASLYYASTAAVNVNVYSGQNGTGTVLGTFALGDNSSGCSIATPYCVWTQAAVQLTAIAQSIGFDAANGVAKFDNIEFSAPAPVPLPAAAWLLVSGIGGLGAMARRRRAAA